jgi:SnoaL-like domain
MTISTADIEDPIGLYSLVAGYCQAVDGQDRELLEQLFAPDASLRFVGGPVDGEASIGRDNVLAWLTDRWQPNRPFSLHLTGNIRITNSDDGVEGVSDFLVFMKDADGALKPALNGRYRDRFARHEGRWVIADRAVHFSG